MCCAGSCACCITGIQWEYLPQNLGFGSGMTCWRRLRDWNEAGVWQRLHEVLLAELNAASRLDWSRWVVDSSHVRALKGGSTRAPRRSTGPGRLEAPSDHRRPRHPARGPADRRQPQRRHATAATARRDPTGPRPHRPVPDASRTRCSLPGATTMPSTVTRSAPGASCPRSPDAAPRTARDQAPTAGPWRGVSRGCTASAVCASDGNAGLTSMKRSSNSPAVSSLTDNSAHCVSPCT